MRECERERTAERRGRKSCAKAAKEFRKGFCLFCGFCGFGVRLLGSSSRLREKLQPRKEPHRRPGVRAAHLGRRPQFGAHGRTLRPAEDAAPVGCIKLHAAHAGRLAMRHAGNGRADRRGDAACCAMGSTVHVRASLPDTATADVQHAGSSRYQKESKSVRIQAPRRRDDLLDDGLDGVPGGLARQGAPGVERVRRARQREGLRRHPALQVEQQRHQVAL